MTQTRADKRESASADQRRSARQLTLQTGTIMGLDETGSFDCAILNISDHGACLLVPTGAMVPKSFTLRVDHDEALHECTLAWRKGAKIGVSFA